MGFDVEYECVLCYLLDGYNTSCSDELMVCRGLVCTHCLERCVGEEEKLHHRVLFGLKDPESRQFCAVCQRQQILLFILVVCRKHRGHFNTDEHKTEADEDAEEEEDLPELVEAVSQKPAASAEHASLPENLPQKQAAALYFLAKEVSERLIAAAKRLETP